MSTQPKRSDSPLVFPDVGLPSAMCHQGASQSAATGAGMETRGQRI